MIDEQFQTSFCVGGNATRKGHRRQKTKIQGKLRIFREIKTPTFRRRHHRPRPRLDAETARQERLRKRDFPARQAPHLLPTRAPCRVAGSGVWPHTAWKLWPQRRDDLAKFCMLLFSSQKWLIQLYKQIRRPSCCANGRTALNHWLQICEMCHWTCFYNWKCVGAPKFSATPGPRRILRKSFGPFWTVLEGFGPCLTVLDRFEPFWTDVCAASSNPGLTCLQPRTDVPPAQDWCAASPRLMWLQTRTDVPPA